VKRLLLALGFLTRLPVPMVAASPADFAAAIRCYPIAGLVIGAVIAAAGHIGAALDPWIGALAALAVWTAITGALHLDGLGDLADGLGAAHGDRARLVAAMADPHAGSFAVVAIGLQLLAKLVLLHAAAPLGWWPLMMVPVAARIGPIAWARWLPPLKPGLGQRVAEAARWRDLLGWTLLLAAACVAVPALLATPVLVVAYAAWLWRRVGGINGDGHGAGIECVETGLLLALVAAGHL
jgi:adenosylcobinamide-GDP ribazoletransferase